MIKKILFVLILAIAIIASLSFTSLGTFGEEAKNRTVWGITLGKSLRAAGLQECRRTEGPYSFKSYDKEDKNCYQTTDLESDACLTQFVPELSFDITVDVVLLDNCDRQSPVQEIQATFGSDDYAKVLPLMIERFGKPSKTENSLIQNSVGVKSQKIESFWNKRGVTVRLANMSNENGFGLLEIIRQDRKRSLAERFQKEHKSDRKLF